jgi:hypothetical protein
MTNNIVPLTEQDMQAVDMEDLALGDGERGPCEILGKANGFDLWVVFKFEGGFYAYHPFMDHPTFPIGYSTATRATAEEVIFDLARLAHRTCSLCLNQQQEYHGYYVFHHMEEYGYFGEDTEARRLIAYTPCFPTLEALKAHVHEVAKVDDDE